jgi:hypothetical protein
MRQELRDWGVPAWTPQSAREALDCDDYDAADDYDHDDYDHDDYAADDYAADDYDYDHDYDHGDYDYDDYYDHGDYAAPTIRPNPRRETERRAARRIARVLDWDSIPQYDRVIQLARQSSDCLRAYGREILWDLSIEEAQRLYRQIPRGIYRESGVSPENWPVWHRLSPESQDHILTLGSCTTDGTPHQGEVLQVRHPSWCRTADVPTWMDLRMHGLWVAEDQLQRSGGPPNNQGWYWVPPDPQWRYISASLGWYRGHLWSAERPTDRRIERAAAAERPRWDLIEPLVADYSAFGALTEIFRERNRQREIHRWRLRRRNKEEPTTVYAHSRPERARRLRAKRAYERRFGIRDSFRLAIQQAQYRESRGGSVPVWAIGEDVHQTIPPKWIIGPAGHPWERDTRSPAFASMPDDHYRKLVGLLDRALHGSPLLRADALRQLGEIHGGNWGTVGRDLYARRNRLRARRDKRERSRCGVVPDGLRRVLSSTYDPLILARGTRKQRAKTRRHKRAWLIHRERQRQWIAIRDSWKQLIVDREIAERQAEVERLMRTRDDDGGLIGWRSWRLDARDGSWVLVSPAYYTVWDEPYLLAVGMDPSSTVRNVAGIHAHWRREDLEKTWVDERYVIGEVRGYGRVALGPEGWRAEECVIVSLEIHPQAVFEADKAVSALRGRYGVPVTVREEEDQCTSP